MEEKVSVIIPTYNRPRWLPETIESALKQTYSYVEIIVVNDGSTDNTEEVLEPYIDKIKYIYKENGGPGSAVNAGIMAATGKYIARLDDDDIFLPEKVELQVRMFQQRPELGLVATDNHIIDTEGEIVETRRVLDFSKHGAFLTLLQHCIFSQPTVMVRKECHDKVGLYRNTYAQDYDMWLRIARAYPVGVIHSPLAMYRRHGSNRSGRLSSSKVTADIQSFICEIIDSASLEELLSAVHSVPHAHDVRGAIFLRHDLCKRAGQEFYKAVKAEPQDMVHRFWSGILLRRIGRYEDADRCFGEVPIGDALYDSSLNAIGLTSRLQNIDDEDEAVLSQMRQDLSKEYNDLMDMTISLAKGQLQ
jgi:teichuronic acid biosynthesis glycosyltransferase TuaG